MPTLPMPGLNYTMQGDIFWMMLRDFPYTNPNQAALGFCKRQIKPNSMMLTWHPQSPMLPLRLSRMVTVSLMWVKPLRFMMISGLK